MARLAAEEEEYASQPAPGGSQPAPGGSQPAPGGSQPAPGGSQPVPGGSQPVPGQSQTDLREPLQRNSQSPVGIPQLQQRSPPGDSQGPQPPGDPVIPPVNGQLPCRDSMPPPNNADPPVSSFQVPPISVVCDSEDPLGASGAHLRPSCLRRTSDDHGSGPGPSNHQTSTPAKSPRGARAGLNVSFNLQDKSLSELFNETGTDSDPNDSTFSPLPKDIPALRRRQTHSADPVPRHTISSKLFSRLSTEGPGRSGEGPEPETTGCKLGQSAAPSTPIARMIESRLKRQQRPQTTDHKDGSQNETTEQADQSEPIAPISEGKVKSKGQTKNKVIQKKKKETAGEDQDFQFSNQTPKGKSNKGQGESRSSTEPSTSKITKSVPNNDEVISTSNKFSKFKFIKKTPDRERPPHSCDTAQSKKRSGSESTIPSPVQTPRADRNEGKENESVNSENTAKRKRNVSQRTLRKLSGFSFDSPVDESPPLVRGRDEVTSSSTQTKTTTTKSVQQESTKQSDVSSSSPDTLRPACTNQRAAGKLGKQEEVMYGTGDVLSSLTGPPPSLFTLPETSLGNLDLSLSGEVSMDYVQGVTHGVGDVPETQSLRRVVSVVRERVAAPPPPVARNHRLRQLCAGLGLANTSGPSSSTTKNNLTVSDGTSHMRAAPLLCQKTSSTSSDGGALRPPTTNHFPNINFSSAGSQVSVGPSTGGRPTSRHGAVAVSPLLAGGTSLFSTGLDFSDDDLDLDTGLQPPVKRPKT